MATGAPPKDADALAESGYATLPQTEAEPEASEASDQAEPEAAPVSSFAWANDRDKALLSPDTFGKGGVALYGDADSPVFVVGFEREHLSPPPARVMAKDRENAWAKYRRIMGIRSTEHEPKITQAAPAPKRKKAAAAKA